MPEEKMLHTGEPAEEDFSDEALSAAYDEFMDAGSTVEDPVEEPIEPEPEAPPTPLTPTAQDPFEVWDNAERSRLGRKVKQLSDNVVTKEDLAEVQKQLKELAQGLQKRGGMPQDEFDDFGEPVAKPPQDMKEIVRQELVRAEQEKARIAQEAQEQYSDGYISQMREMLNDIDDKAARNKIWELMTSDNLEYNSKHSNDPVRDCAKNFAKAFRHVVSGAADKQNPPAKRNGPTGPTNVLSSSGSQARGKAPVPKLDSVAAEFAKRMGMTQDEVAEALGGETPLNLKGKKVSLRG